MLTAFMHREEIMDSTGSSDLDPNDPANVTISVAEYVRLVEYQNILAGLVVDVEPREVWNV